MIHTSLWQLLPWLSAGQNVHCSQMMNWAGQCAGHQPATLQKTVSKLQRPHGEQFVSKDAMRTSAQTQHQSDPKRKRLKPSLNGGCSVHCARPQAKCQAQSVRCAGVPLQDVFPAGRQQLTKQSCSAAASLRLARRTLHQAPSAWRHSLHSECKQNKAQRS